MNTYNLSKILEQCDCRPSACRGRGGTPASPFLVCLFPVPVCPPAILFRVFSHARPLFRGGRAASFRHCFHPRAAISLTHHHCPVNTLPVTCCTCRRLAGAIDRGAQPGEQQVERRRPHAVGVSRSSDRRAQLLSTCSDKSHKQASGSYLAPSAPGLSGLIIAAALSPICSFSPTTARTAAHLPSGIPHATPAAASAAACRLV